MNEVWAGEIVDNNGQENCAECSHPLGPHAIISTGTTPVDGGIMLCPHKDCQCLLFWNTTYGVALIDITIPSPEDIRELRQRLQTEGLT